MLRFAILWAEQATTSNVLPVADAGTLMIPVVEDQVRVRPSGIQAPENGHPYGTEAKQAVSDKVFGREVVVETAGKDRYVRTVGCGKIEVGDK